MSHWSVKKLRQVLLLGGTPLNARRSSEYALWLAAFVLYLFLIVRNAWLSDDGFVTFRAADNLVHGFGFTYNVSERVQAFTNPLWALVLAVPYVLTNNIYFAAMATSLLASGIAVALLGRRLAAGGVLAAAGTLIICLSKAFVDYSTSGLENPLTFLLLALFFWIYLDKRDGSRRVFWLFFLTAWLATTRLDTLFLVVPPLCHGLVTAFSRRAVLQAAVGLVPLVIWELFSLVYYGFPLPNTAYAKLNTELETAHFVGQGLAYLVDSISRDPITLVTIGTVVLLSFRPCPPARAESKAVHDGYRISAALGVLLYVAYVLKIGGDFMAGRMLTAPFFVAVILLVRSLGPELRPRHVQVLVAGAVFISFGLPQGPWHDQTNCKVPESGIVNERVCYQAHTALVFNLHSLDYKTHPYYIEGEKIAQSGQKIGTKGAVGMAGFAAGPGFHLVNNYALSEPLLARIRHRYSDGWRIGHLVRPIPKGYIETLTTGKNVIVDPCLREFYDHLRVIIRGPLFKWKRFKTIVAMNFGAYDYLVHPECAERRAGN